MSEPDRYAQAARSPEFLQLRRRLRRFIFPMTVAFFLWYALYVVLSAFARGFMGTVLFGNINVAIVFGLLQFLTTFVIAWAYTRFAGSQLDPIAEQIKSDVEGKA